MVVDYWLSCKELTTLQSCRKKSLQNPDKTPGTVWGVHLESIRSPSGVHQESIRRLSGVSGLLMESIRKRGGVSVTGTAYAPTLPLTRTPSLMRAPSLSCACPPSRALTLPLVRSPSLACNHPPLSISCTRPLSHAPTHPFMRLPSLSFSCTRPPSRSRAPACPLVLTAVLVGWCCYCSSHCCRCWRWCSCSSSCCCCRAHVRAPSYVPAGPPVCVRLLRACPFFCLCTSIYKSIVSMLIMDLRLTLL